ncbi:plasmid partitioning protein RepA [Rhizobium tumorigenes]|uniref:Plasmid partitioning protein RepA n=1 Tax=Rhizobium tumorigenes TaxID=2041385 RepID=A0AAF1KKY7_9HYPH|nr:plasmid partitioning protein RepA [Rhizobium tumorigenes]WFR97761.1 plasmid partitioning protein RepA [Rhizobium tumorigenes]
MAQIIGNIPPADESLMGLIERHSDTLSSQLQAHHLSVFPPHAEKTIRFFQPAEAARFIGVKEVYLRTLANDLAADLDVSTGPAGRRSYSAMDMHKIRNHLDKVGRGSRRYLPHRRNAEDLQVISVMNFKGGSGKTTTAAHLAQYLALRGYRVLAIDLDPQASLSTLLGVQPETDVGEGETLYGALRYGAPRPMHEIVRGTYIPDLHLVPGNLELMEFEHDTPRALMKRKPGDVMFFQRMKAALASVKDNYDVVVVDCPPQLGYLTLSAIAAATSLLVTVHPQMLDVMSMNQFLSMMSDLLREIAGHGAEFDYKWMRYLITRFEPSDGPQNQMVGYLRAMFGDNVLIHPMLKTTAVSDAGLTNQTLFEVERGAFTRATYDRAMEAMNNVNGEIESLIRKAWGRAA